MMRGLSRNMMLPAFVGSAVLVVALTLLSIVARSPYTHANLDASFDSRYTRTEQTLLSSPLGFSGDRLAVPPASDPVQHGAQLFVADGCASCHGLDGRGGIVGPAIVGAKVQKLRTMTNVGPQGMPAYAPGALSDADLEAMAAFLNAASK